MRLTQCACFILVLLADCLPSWSQSTTPVSVLNLGGFVRTTSGASGIRKHRLWSPDLTRRKLRAVGVGHLRVQAERSAGDRSRSARLPADPGRENLRRSPGSGADRAAIANPNPQLVTISFFFTDEIGGRFAEGSTTIRRTARSHGFWMRLRSTADQPSREHSHLHRLYRSGRPRCADL